MKQNILQLFATAMVAVLLFAGCKKEDVTKPVITLIGDNPMTVPLGGTFSDPGATATDDVDGDLTSGIAASGTVDVDAPGAYTRSYVVSDAAGNAGTATRTVNVVLTRDAILGAYTTTNNCPTPQSFVATSTNFQAGSSDGKFVINMFYYNGGTLTCTLSGTTVTVDAGQAPNPQFTPVTGSGTFSASGTQLTMNYVFDPTGSNVSCTVVYTLN
ncbi:MAG TPA: DUF5011 domain-containing protein [Bacteroidia bacterium]|nr:DUF5011 domain-containing protein [Bacteroidia bacterium]